MGNVASDGASESSTPHPVYENVPSPQEEPPTPTPGSRSNTSYHYQPSSAATSYQPGPPQQPGQKTVSSSHSYGDVNSQSYRQPGNKASSHTSQQPSYGYVRTSRSAPVTPVPPQISQIPDQQPANVGRSAMPPDRGRQYYDDASRPHTHTEKQIASNAPPDRKAYNMVDSARYGPPQKNNQHSRSEFEAAKSDSTSSRSTSQPVYQNHPLPSSAHQPLPSSAHQPLPSSAHQPSYANIPRRESSQKQHPNYYNVSSDAPPVREYRYTPTSSVSDSVSSGYSYQSSQPRTEHLYSNSSVPLPQGHSSQHFGHFSQLSGHSSQPSGHSSQRSTHSSQSQYPPHPSSQHPPSSQSQSQFTAPAQQASQKPAYQHPHQSQYNQNPYQYSQRDPSPNPSYRSNKQPHQPPHYSSTPTKDRGNFPPQSQPQQYSHSKGNSEGFSYSRAPDDYPDRRSSYLEAQDARAPQQYINPHDVRSRHDLDQFRGNNYYK